jgi:ubiquinone/menaquinone biosynthesis C-methylase UbiE
MIEKNPSMKRSIQEWWASNPMTYAQEHGRTVYVTQDGTRQEVELGNKDFFEAADQTFYTWNRPLHTSKGKFAKIFNYEHYRDKNVLEIGCGMGCMAMNWAIHQAKVTAVDLNPVAVQQTMRRFQAFGLIGNIIQVDGEWLPFNCQSFDYVYSWGVLHHTPGIRSAINEIDRILRPDGETGIMLYNRNSFLYKYLVQYVEGYLHMENQFLNSLRLASRYGDGARQEGNPYTWPVTKQEIFKDLCKQFKRVSIQVFGTDLDSVLDNWFPKFGSRIMPRTMIKSLARRWGWSLWITATK